jgi:hypothetical protein
VHLVLQEVSDQLGQLDQRVQQEVLVQLVLQELKEKLELQALRVLLK